MVNVVTKIRKFVEEECKKPTNHYGYELYELHFIPMAKYSRVLAKKLNADAEIVELAAWLHDIGAVIYGRENHHITGAQIAETKLKEFNYPQDRMERVRQCILSHRGSKRIKPKSIEAKIIADIDGLECFDRIDGLFMNAYVNEGLSQKQARKSVREKLEREYLKVSPEVKKLIKDKYKSAMLLLK